MGESRANGDNILGNLTWKGAYYVKDEFMLIEQDTACLYRFNADKFKYVHTQPFGYNKCKIYSAFEAALVVETSNGEKKHDC